jgi:hypothetical protein
MLNRGPLLSLVALAALAGTAVAADQGVMEHKPGFGDAVASPLRDLNLERVEIPAVLTRAVANPYDLTGLDRCEGIAGEVGRLDEVLGRDLDEAPPPDRRTRTQKAASAAHDGLVDETSSHISHFIPFRTWVRKLSGAERHEKRVQAAIRAGGIRRGYLKGVGMRMNCAPPAAPSWFKPAPPGAAPLRGAPSSGWAAFWAGVVAWFRSWWPF